MTSNQHGVYGTGIPIAWPHYQEMYNNDPRRAGYCDTETIMYLKLRYGNITTKEFGSVIQHTNEILSA